MSEEEFETYSQIIDIIAELGAWLEQHRKEKQLEQLQISIEPVELSIIETA